MASPPTLAALHAAGRLSTRARNALRWADCGTLADVAAMTTAQVGRIDNVGSKTLAEIGAVLAEYGLAFARPVVVEEVWVEDPFPAARILCIWPAEALSYLVDQIDGGAVYPGVSSERLGLFTFAAEGIIEAEQGKRAA